MKRFIGFLFLATACAVPQTSETKEDSVAVLSNDTLEMATDQLEPVDTVFNTIEKKENANPRLDPKVAYNWSFSNLDVYKEANNTSEKLGESKFKDKILLKEEIRGAFVAIDFNGSTGYVAADAVMPLPVPETTDVLEYFKANLMLTKDVVERSNPGEPDSEGSFRYVDYYFEGGYKVSVGSQYESGFSAVKLPGMTMEKAFMFISYFEESFQNAFEEYPKAARKEELPNEQYLTVEMSGDKVQKIIVGNGLGCYEEASISIIDGGVEMRSEGGC